MRSALFVIPLFALALGGVPLTAADLLAPNHNPALPRLVAQALVGTSGFEPGIAAEWRLGHDADIVVRPEVFLNEDADVGGGASLSWELRFLDLPDRQSLTVGPRVVYHNSDDSGWEADAMAIWSLDFCTQPRGRHYLEVIGAVGVRQDEPDGKDDTKLGASIGVGYGFQF